MNGLLRPALRRVLVGAALLGLSLATAPDAGGDGGAATRSTGWHVEVRVVRVTTSAATVEHAPALPGSRPDGTTTAAWPDLLAALKARGTTQIVMDRSGSAVSGAPISLEQRQSENVLATIRADRGNTQLEARPLATGATVWLLVAGASDALPPRLDYDASVEWARASPQRTAPITSLAKWKGAHAPVGDATLVLRHAEQDGLGGGTEVYVLIELRRRAD